MKINELEELLDIPRANIRYYEKEKLFTPKRGVNGYREYSEHDVERLKKIIILRKLGISVQDIRDILEERVALADILAKNETELREQMTELTGALAMCEQMEKDQASVTNFNTEYYWNVIDQKERSGQRFMDLLRDYGAHEKTLFYNFFASPFIYKENGKTYGKRVLVVIISILFFCALGGIVVGEEPGSTGFWLYTLRPLIMFAALSILSIPIFLLERRYRGVEEPVVKKGMNLPGMILFVVVWIVLFLFGIPTGMEIFYYDRINGADSFYIINGLSFYIYYILGLAGMLIYLWLFSKRGIFADHWNGEEGWRCKLPWKVRYQIAGITGVILVAGTLLYMFNYNQFTVDGVTQHRLFWEKEYTWEDVESQTYRLDDYMNLECNILMKDGTRASWNNVALGIRFEHDPKVGTIRQESDYSYYVVKLLHEQGKDSADCDWQVVEENIEYSMQLREAEQQLYGTYTDQIIPGVTITIDADYITTNMLASYALSQMADGVKLTITPAGILSPVTYTVISGEGGIHTIEEQGTKRSLTLSSGADGLDGTSADYFEGSYSAMDCFATGFEFHEDGTVVLTFRQMYGIDSDGILWLDEDENEEAKGYTYELADGMLTLKNSDGDIHESWIRE